MQHVIYDLDGTVICTKHRYTAKENGDIDLDAWIRDNTPEKAANDTLLPTIRTMRADYSAGCIIIVCTSRVLFDHDYSFFMENNVPYHVMLDRPLGCTLADADLKEFQLRLYAHQKKLSWVRFCKTSTFFEDNPSVITRMEEIGMPIIEAPLWNKQLDMLR